MASLEGRVLLSTTIGLNFTGNTLTDVRNLTGGTLAPPDSNGAIGPNHFVEFTNGTFAIYDKASGAVVGSKMTDATFWTSKVGISSATISAGLSDTRILFDPSSQRWIAAEITTESTGNKLLVGRSDTSDPTGTWKGASFLADSGFADFPTLGLDADAVYIGTNNFTSSTGTFANVSLFSIPKSDLTASPPNLANMTAFRDRASGTLGFALQGAIDLGVSKGHGSIVAVSDSAYGQLQRTDVTNPGAAGATLTPTTTINVAPTSAPPLAAQPDGTVAIDTGDDRISGAAYQVGNRLYLAHTIGVSNRAAIRWTILDESTNAVLQEGTIGDPNFDFYYPSIAANANGDVVIGYSRSGSSAGAYISSYASVGHTSGGTVTFDAPLLLKAGQATYHLFGGTGERWGDYSATTVDPSNPSVFWTVQEVAGTNNVWTTQVTQLTVGTTAQVPALSIGNVTRADGSSGTTSFDFTVSLNQASTQTVTVDYATADGTATTAGNDYVGTSGTLTFAPGVTTQTISVPVVGGTTYDATETFKVNLSNPANATLAVSQGVGTILNDDPAPALSISNVTVVEPDSGTANAAFKVSLSAPSDVPVTVHYATADGTAKSRGDIAYQATSGTLTIPAGATSGTINVTIRAGSAIEPDETFFVNLSNATNATIAGARGQGTIQNDENRLSINGVSHAEGTSGQTPFVFTVTLSPAASFPVTVAYATADGTATTADGDYVGTSGTLTFAPGVTTQTISVPVNGDADAEPTETFTVNLSNPTNASLSVASGTGTVLDGGAPAASVVPQASAAPPATALIATAPGSSDLLNGVLDPTRPSGSPRRKGATA